MTLVGYPVSVGTVEGVTWSEHGAALQSDSRPLSTVVQAAGRPGGIPGTGECDSVCHRAPIGSSGWSPAIPRLPAWTGYLWDVGWMDADWNMASAGIKKFITEPGGGSPCL